jgi:hypothetical protein
MFSTCVSVYRCDEYVFVVRQTGTFWHAGSEPHYRQHLGDSYGSDSSYPRYESDQAYDQYAGEARIQRLGPNSALSGPAGVRPCISCSEVFPDGSSTTLDVGSTSSKDCVCNPGKRMGLPQLGQPICARYNGLPKCRPNPRPKTCTFAGCHACYSNLTAGCCCCIGC